MHEQYERALGDPAPEQWHWLLLGKGNHIASGGVALRPHRG
ncbi:MAG: hypothetical protein U0531_20000 [Dehalococcoidia bacterium]